MISIVIPTLNEERNIGRILKILKLQLGPKDEIIVVDSRSTDRTVTVAKRYTKRIYLTPREGIGKARTFGASKAKNIYVAFLDADTVPSDNWVALAKRHMSSGASGAAGLGLYEGRWMRYLYNMFSRFVFYGAGLTYAISKTPYLIGNNMVIDRRIFMRAGGFRSVVCEDFDLGKRLKGHGSGYVFDPAMKVVYSSRKFEDHGFAATLVQWGAAVMAIQLGNGKRSADYSGWRT